MTPAPSATAQAVAEMLSRAASASMSGDQIAARQWETFVDAGLPWAAVPLSRSGPGGAIGDAADILREVGRAGAAVPAGETDLLGEWLLDVAGLPSPSELLAVAPGTPSDDLRLRRRGDAFMLTGTAERVPWASASSRFVALVSDGNHDHVVSVPMERLTVANGESLAGEARDSLTANDICLAPEEHRRLTGSDRLALRARGAATRVLLINGAVEAVVDLVDTYCTTRTQFGRRLRDFQVVAHQLAVLREQVTLAGTAADLAVAVLAGSASWEEAATAKVVAGEVATQVAKIAHQLHGAIGVSDEYALHRFTRRLWSWRDEYGGEHEWARRLGDVIIARQADALWPWMTDSLRAVQ